MRKHLLILLTCCCGAAMAQEIRHIQPQGLAKSPAYSHVVTAKPGTVIWVAGQIAQNAKGEMVGKGDVKAQAAQAWENVRIALAAAGATFKDAVKVNVFVVGYKPSMREELRAARLHAMGPGEPPASTLVGVQALATEDILVEIEATAVIANK
jgi:enamine deaminase RidA (YjgF/YER057c/UK114 family)